MVTVHEAESIILKNIVSLPDVRVPLGQAFGRVLREDVIADRDLPSFDRATMDGIAIHGMSLTKGIRRFFVEGLQKAGISALSLRKRDGCLEITTGAMLSKGCDCVIPLEDIEIKGRIAHIRTGSQVKLSYVHRKGSDARKGTVLLHAGCRLSTAQIAVAASVGKDKVLVAQLPDIAIVGTGDELVEIDRPVRPFQIRRSNTYALACGLVLNGYPNVRRFHIRDHLETLRTRLKKILARYNVVILSGGVSAGKLDFVPQVLEELGVRLLFHKVRQRPGGPFLFGKTTQGKPIFGLPGNPVSTQICLYRYVLAYLNKAARLPSKTRHFVTLSQPVQVKTPLTCFLPVQIASTKDGRITAAPIFLKNSGDYVALSKSDGFIELSAETFRFRQGSAHPFYSMK